MMHLHIIYKLYKLNDYRYMIHAFRIFRAYHKHPQIFEHIFTLRHPWWKSHPGFHLPDKIICPKPPGLLRRFRNGQGTFVKQGRWCLACCPGNNGYRYPFATRPLIAARCDRQLELAMEDLRILQWDVLLCFDVAEEFWGSKRQEGKT